MKDDPSTAQHDVPRYTAPHEALKEPLLERHEDTYQPPAYSGDYRKQGWCPMVFKLFVFHFLNALLSIVANFVVDVGVTVSIALLPLCCLGLFVFRGVLFAVQFFAALDVKLYNFISAPRDHVYLSLPQPGVAGRRISPSLASVTPLSLLATLYFVTIKAFLGTISLVVFALALIAPVIGVAAFQDSHDHRVAPIVCVLVTLAAVVLSIVLMHLAACLSRIATRFFCCERFSTYHYVYGQRDVYSYHV